MSESEADEDYVWEEVVGPEDCTHNWEPGDLYSDFICSECGKRGYLE